VLEDIEGLWLESHNVASPAQFAPVGIKSIVFEQVTHSRFPGASASKIAFWRTRINKLAVRKKKLF